MLLDPGPMSLSYIVRGKGALPFAPVIYGSEILFHKEIVRLKVLFQAGHHFNEIAGAVADVQLLFQNAVPAVFARPR